MMKFQKRAVAIALSVATALFICGILIFVLQRPRREAPVQVLYFVKVLLTNDQVHLDPANLALVQQYYLLENLAIGLLRDDHQAVSGYKPGLATQWSQVSDRRWVFKLADDNLWSDGSKIDGQYIADEICQLRQRRSRHLRILPLLETCEYSAATNSLTMDFSRPVDSWLLHELSLADAALLHPRNRVDDWSITSGAYAVKSVKAETPEILLQKNPLSKDLEPSAPDSVRMFWVKDPAELEKAFKDLKVDLYPTLPHRFSRRQQIMTQQAPEVFSGFPNTLHFFRFNWNNPLTKSLATRQAFAGMVREAFKSWDYRDILRFDPQFIPVGHQGRLSEYAGEMVDNREALRGFELTLRFNPQVKELPEFESRLNKAAQKHGCKLNIVYAETSQADATPESFASLYIFRGNQKDALGNWSFLFSQGGAFEPYEKAVDQQFNAVVSTTNENERTKQLDMIHRQALEQVYGVPVFFESGAILSSGRYDLSALNRFDLRPRFFRMKLK